MIQLTVQWPNAGHPLLANPLIVLTTGDKQDLQPTIEAKGAVVYEIPDGVTQVDLLAMFQPELSYVGTDGKRTSELFRVWVAEQTFVIDGQAMTPDKGTIWTPEPFSVRGPDHDGWTRQTHPLIHMVVAANAVSGVAVAELRTEFVDITAYFMKASERIGDWPYFQLDRNLASEFIAVGATAGDPPVWFVNCPASLTPPQPQTGAFVFFRPAQSEAYAHATDRGLANGLSALERYLCPLKDDQPLVHGELTLPAWAGRFPYCVPDNFILRCGVQDALINSGKPMVMLHPWPTAGTNFGVATTSKMPLAASQILLFLQGGGYIGQGMDDLTLGRLGVGGYSAGGPPTIAALKANKSRVSEVYLFDPVKITESAPFVIDWARKTQDFRLRLSGGEFWSSLESIRRSLTTQISGEAGDLQLSIRPPSPKSWKTVDEGGGTYWNFCISKTEKFRDDFNVRHQFAIFGGEYPDTGFGPDASFNMITWMEEFLTNSGY